MTFLFALCRFTIILDITLNNNNNNNKKKKKKRKGRVKIIKRGTHVLNGYMIHRLPYSLYQKDPVLRVEYLVVNQHEPQLNHVLEYSKS